ncbi:iron-containing redox enzyme family protein [Microbacterium sp. 22242]|uniref:iron-containing redox enzyme family protein n=1 Tax=Microbacterium sp. 22242 TaxID=3453896 RepID=UPI003F86E82C
MNATPIAAPTTIPAPTPTATPTPKAAPTAAFAARGPLSAALLDALTGAEAGGDLVALAERAVAEAVDILRDDDVQISLYALYASAYGSVPAFDAHREWDPQLIQVRMLLEEPFERALRDLVPADPLPACAQGAVASALFALTSADSGPSLSRYVAKKATREQALEFLVQRSIYTLREADPHSWAIPRLHGRAKAALVEIQADEYGGGRLDRVHAEIFAKAMRGAGLDDRYGGYVDDVPAVTLCSLNTMSLFGLNRRLLGAIVGHLAAFEMTSSIPNRLYGDGLRRLGFGDDVTDYFDEHVEADAVHEQIAGRDLAGALAEDQPELLPDIMFGAAACLVVDGRVGAHMLERWQNGESSLRIPEAVA